MSWLSDDGPIGPPFGPETPRAERVAAGISPLEPYFVDLMCAAKRQQIEDYQREGMNPPWWLWDELNDWTAKARQDFWRAR